MPAQSFFGDYLAYVMPTTDAPVWFHVASALSLASHLINRRAWLASGLDTYFPNLWIGVIAKSGQRKSSAINPARELLRDDLDYGQTLPDSFTFAALVKELGVEIRDDHENTPLPTLQEARFLCRQDDEEKEHYSRGIGYFHFSEIATFLATLGKSYNDEAKATLTDWYDCPTERTKKTTTQSKYYIYRPFISILGGSTIDWLVEGCRESDLMGGFLPRWLFFTNTSQDFELSFRDTGDPRLRDKLQAHCEKLKSYQGEVRYSDEAMDAYHDWYQAFVKDTDAVMASWSARLAAYAHKIAIVFEAVTTRRNVIGVETSQLACKLVSRLKIDLAQMLDEQLAFSEVDKQCNRLMELIRAHGGRVEHSMALRSMRGMDARTLRSVIVPTLVERAKIKPDNEPTSAGRSRLVYLAV